MPDIMNEDKHVIHNIDCIRHMYEMPDNSVDLIVTSPPFFSMFSYTELVNDLGNIEDVAEAKVHYRYLFEGIKRVLKPGRVACIHCMNMPPMSRANRKGMFDFRGFLLRCALRSGLVYDNEWMVWKNPQVQAVRNHSINLLFVTLTRDRSVSGPCLPDYVLKFVKDGENLVPITSPGITREEWINWASPCWHDIRQTETLNVKEARTDKDVKHICALQLPLISRLIRLFSNPDEIVFDPFTGIGSTGYECMKLDRRFYGCELKPEYHAVAIRNINRAIEKSRLNSASLFDMLDPSDDANPDDESDDTARIQENYYDDRDGPAAIEPDTGEYSMAE